MQQMSMFEVSRPCAQKANGTQGSQAVRSGKAAEDTIYCILKERGYHVERQQIVGNSIAGGNIVADFVVYGHSEFETGLIIESKWQEVQGSADQKLLYLLTEIRTRYPCPTVIVVGGGGHRAGIIEHLRNHVGYDNLHAVMSFEEFLAWVIRHF